MSGSPEYYSGRGIRTSDLNYTILIKIAELIEKYHGDDAKKNFVLMVSKLKTANATDFLNELYRLQANDWKIMKFIIHQE